MNANYKICCFLIVLAVSFIGSSGYILAGELNFLFKSNIKLRQKEVSSAPQRNPYYLYTCKCQSGETCLCHVEGNHCHCYQQATKYWIAKKPAKVKKKASSSKAATKKKSVTIIREYDYGYNFSNN